MSTRCNVAICLREDDRSKTFTSPNSPDFTISPDGAKYLVIYIHNDGYPEGVGEDLVRLAEGATYEDILNFILEGDRSTVLNSYYAWRQEPWKYIKPDPMYNPELNEEYLYGFFEQPDGSMTVKIYNEHKNEWISFDKYTDEDNEDW